MKNLSKNDGKFRQFLAAVVVNLSALTYGTLCSWPSPVFPLLKSDKNPISKELLTEVEASWIGALLCLSSLFVSPFAGTLIERFGRKRFGYAITVPVLISWLLTIFATSHACLFVARFFAGIGGMGMFLVPIYVSEIASEDIRGALGSLMLFAINVGILLTFVAGSFMTYRLFGVFLMIFPMLFLGSFIFMPETPVYLMKNNQLNQARKSLMFFKGNNEVLVEQELLRLQFQLNKSSESTRKPGFNDLFKDRATFKGTIISLALLGGQQLSGIVAMISYAESIFKMAGSSLSPNTAAIIIGVIQIFGSYLSTLMMERAGRRPLILISCAGMCVCHFIVGGFCYLQNTGYDMDFISWLPVAALSTYMISYCLGMGPAPFVIASEIFRLDITSFANTVCYVYLWLMGFLVMKFFGSAVELLGIEGCFFLLGLFCAGSFLFSYIMIPETKGRKREEIVDELAGINRPSSYYDEKIFVSDKAGSLKDIMTAEQV